MSVSVTGGTIMLAYDFMRTAFLASGIVAMLSGLVGYFLVLRNQTFAGHALAHVGFTGATGAILVGIAPLWGLVGFTLIAGMAMGALGERLSARDVAIGMTLSLALGFGLLFLHFYTAFATQATALLFGNVLGVDREALWSLAGLAAISMTVLAVVSRPLLFASLQPELAEAKGVPMRLVSVVFLGIVAVAVSESSQIVGVLLVFTLMVGPAAAARNLSPRFGVGIALSAALALAEAWGGVALAWFTDWPVSFWITALSALAYGLSFAPGGVAGVRNAAWRRRARGEGTAERPVDDGGSRRLSPEPPRRWIPVAAPMRRADRHRES